MKVYIGKYKSWLTTRRFEDWMEDKLNVPEKISDAIGNFFQPLIHFCWNKWQPERIEYVKVDRYDAWNANNTLALIIYPVLVELRKQTHGAPHTDYEDAPEHLRPKEEP